ncbi:MAG TPA: hypothetical protein VEG08_10800 [Terriglobales bacterium]|nr:hypothetical protein [Terriglobales bacterium]
MLTLLATLAAPALAQQTPKVSLESSESLFAVLAGINACGYDQELTASDPLRMRLRSEVAEAAQASPEAQEARKAMCDFYADHRANDPSRDLAQYVSLGLNLGEPPKMAPSMREADLPPDAGYVLGFVPVLERFYQAAGLHALYEKHRADFEALTEQFSPSIAEMILRTDSYLRLPIAGYSGRHMAIYLEPLAAPGQINARNYGADYFLVVSPAGGAIPMEQIRHTYLHFALDPLAMRRGTTMRRLETLELSVKAAPLDESFKRDIVLLVNESLIRAIEARQIDARNPAAEPARRAAVERAEKEGFILTLYFYQRLTKFETDKDSVGLQDAYPDMLYDIDVDQVRKHAEGIQFAAEAAPEVMRASNPRQASALDQAEALLASGDAAGAAKLAQQALERQEDPGRALFILARAAALSRDMQGAVSYFQRTLEVAHEPRTLAWSHIYLGRIYDLQQEREQALEQYRAALAAGDAAADTKAAAERGLQQPYAPPGQPRR